MDFWSRLLSPLSSGTSRRDQTKDPTKRLHRFEKEYGNLLSTWRTSSSLSRDSEAAETVEIRLQELTNILNDESHRPLPHPCIQYAAIKQMYVPIGKIATTSYDEWIIKEAVLFFATLVESEEEFFVENATFSSSLTNLLVRITGVNSVRLGLDTESRVVELAFNITTKIRLDPEILPAWFKTPDAATRKDVQERDARERFTGRTQWADFPLFYILMDYIQHEGKIGDFARTGLLYIIEAASSSVSLEQWVVESDLSTLMATGLGALYSQLSRKLVIDHPPHDLPPILALSDYEHPTSYDIVSSCSPEFQSHLETFLSHLLFWQDVLNHCKSVKVKSTLLEHFHTIFLQQLLYPSLLESSDIDGGSSVAVLTYLRRILESLDHPDMIDLILHYLLALPDAPVSSSVLVSDAQRRKSLDLETMMAEKSTETTTPLLFNLVDLILGCLRSRNQQTIQVTLQLVSTIVKRHHRYAVLTLLKTEVLSGTMMNRTVGAHKQEIEYLVSLAGSIGGQANFDAMYGNTLKDTMARLKGHSCSLRLVAPRVSTNNDSMSGVVADSIASAPRDVREHTLRTDDPLLNMMLDFLETFFINPVEMNLSVTETLVDLAICGYMSIEGWLARSSKSYAFPDSDEDGKGAGVTGKEEEEEETRGGRNEQAGCNADRCEKAKTLGTGPDGFGSQSLAERQRLEALEKCRRQPQWSQESVPRALAVLKWLCDQVSSYKETIPRFEELLQQRREAFQAAETMLDDLPAARRASPAASQGTPEGASPDRPIRGGSPFRPWALEGFAQRLLSELGTPSGSGSPRGRKERSRSSGNTTPGLVEPGIPRAMRANPKEFPTPHADPSKSGIGRSFSGSRVLRDRVPSPSEMENSATGQAAEFAAIDQNILARRVGLPDVKLKLMPIGLNQDNRTARPAMEAGSTPGAIQTEGNMEEGRDEDGDISKTTGKGDVTEMRTEKTGASVSHVITNVIVLQSFLLELAGLLQVRAGLFGEVRYA